MNTHPPPSNEERSFLSSCLEWAFALEVYDPEAVLKRFPPRILLRAFDHEPEVRGAVLTASKLSRRPGEAPAALGDRVLCAYERGDASAGDIVSAMPLVTSARVLAHLAPHRDAWAFLLDVSPEAHGERGAAFVSFLVQRGVQEGLIEPSTLAKPSLVEPLIEAMNREQLEAALRWNLRNGKPSELVEILPVELISTGSSVAALWEDVARPALLRALRRSEAPPSITFEYTDLFDDEDLEEETTASRRLRPSTIPPSPDSTVASERAAIEGALASAGRLPPRYEHLPLAVLRGLEALVWSLGAARDADERKACFLRPFRNDGELRLALTALLPIFFDETEEVRLSLLPTAQLVAVLEEADRAAKGGVGVETRSPPSDLLRALAEPSAGPSSEPAETAPKQSHR